MAANVEKKANNAAPEMTALDFIVSKEAKDFWRVNFGVTVSINANHGGVWWWRHVTDTCLS